MKKLFLIVLLTASVAAAQSQGAGTGVTPYDKALQAKTVAEALSMLGVQSPEFGKLVLLETPDIVNEGKKFSVNVSSKMPGTDWIAVLAERNAFPMIQAQDFSPGADRSVRLNVSLTQTSKIRAVIRSGGKYYQVVREVKVARRGCEKP